MISSIWCYHSRGFEYGTGLYCCRCWWLAGWLRRCCCRVNVTLFSRVTLIRKLQSTSDLNHFHACDLLCSRVKSRDDPISDRQGDSGVPCSFMYIDNSCMFFLLQGMDIRPPYHIMDVNGGHLWYYTVWSQPTYDSSMCIRLSFDNDCIVNSCAVVHQVNLTSVEACHNVNWAALLYWVPCTSRQMCGGDLLMVWSESLLWIHQLPKQIVQLQQTRRPLQLVENDSVIDAQLAVLWYNANSVQSYCSFVPPCRILHCYELLHMSQFAWSIHCS